MTQAAGAGDGVRAPARPPWQLVLSGVVAVASLLGLAGFIRYMLGMTAANDVEWTRSVYLYTPVETVAFAAVGWLFGREVHRQEAQRAEQRVSAAEARLSTAEQRASDAQAKAAEATTKGLALAAATRAKAAALAERSDGLVPKAIGETPPWAADGPAGPAAALSDVRELAYLAERLYPDVAG
jgi:hypothetical protein